MKGVTSVSFGLSWGMLGPSVSAFLYETFGGRPRKTEAFVRTDGTIATMRMAMDRHAVGTWSLLEIAAEKREELLQDAHRVVVKAVEDARSGPVREPWSFRRTGRVSIHRRYERIVERLTLQGVQVERLQEHVHNRSRVIFSRSVELAGRTFSAGKLHHRYGAAHVASRPHASRSADRKRLSRRSSYPIRAKCLITTRPGVSCPSSLASRPMRWKHPLPQDVTSSRLLPDAREVSSASMRDGPPYAYLLPAGHEASYRIIIRLMREGYRWRVFRAPFRIGDRNYPKGTWAAIRGRNPEGLGARLEALVEEHVGQGHRGGRSLHRCRCGFWGRQSLGAYSQTSRGRGRRPARVSGPHLWRYSTVSGGGLRIRLHARDAGDRSTAGICRNTRPWFCRMRVWIFAAVRVSTLVTRGSLMSRTCVVTCLAVARSLPSRVQRKSSRQTKYWVLVWSSRDGPSKRTDRRSALVGKNRSPPTSRP